MMFFFGVRKLRGVLAARTQGSSAVPCTPRTLRALNANRGPLALCMHTCDVVAGCSAPMHRLDASGGVALLCVASAAQGVDMAPSHAPTFHRLDAHCGSMVVRLPTI